MQNSSRYRSLSTFYDLFELIFLLGNKGNPRRGLLDAFGDTPQLILDVCVGTAASSLLLAGHNPQNQILGIDISSEMLAVARRRIAEKTLTNLEVKNMSATALQLEDDTFDGVMISFALHEFERETREKVLREATRVLKPGGAFCVLDFARQAGRLNWAFLEVWGIFEPPCFAGFLGIDWRVDLDAYGLRFESEKKFSFSKLYTLRKALGTGRLSIPPAPGSSRRRIQPMLGGRCP
jgi:ubiquinone/menaquinone biosynthesis C-methylase UbiE